MKNSIAICLGVVAGLVIIKAKRREAARTVIDEARITDGTNWTGDMWARLSGLDLVSRDFRNLDGSANADLSKVGQAGIGLVAGWDGSL